MPVSDFEIKTKMAVEFKKALKSLAGYKFLMFGYHAANWVNLNKLLPVKQPNPFGPIVRKARQIREWIDS